MIFDEATTKQLTGILADMDKPVKIILFKGDNDKSKETEEFVTEFSAFNPKMSLTIYDIDKDTEKAKEWNAFASPAIYVTTEDESQKGVGFYGTPGGYEISSFLMSVLEVSGKHMETISEAHKTIIDSVKEVLHIYTYISLTCPLCPQAVMNIHRLAITNPNIRAYMVEGPAFKEYAQKFNVQALPTIIFGESDKTLVGENARDFNQLVELLK